MSVTWAPRARSVVNASCPGVSMKTIRLPPASIVEAPICCVIPPNSRAATSVCRIASSRDVFPWSTCPMIVTTGGRGTAASSLASSSRLGAAAAGAGAAGSGLRTFEPSDSAIFAATSTVICWLIPASTRCSRRRFTTSPPLSPSFAASSPTVRGPAMSISAGTTGGGATGSGGGGGGSRSLILGGRSLGGITIGDGAGAGAPAACAAASPRARGRGGRGGASRRGVGDDRLGRGRRRDDLSHAEDAFPTGCGGHPGRFRLRLRPPLHVPPHAVHRRLVQRAAVALERNFHAGQQIHDGLAAHAQFFGQLMHTHASIAPLPEIVP